MAASLSALSREIDAAGHFMMVKVTSRWEDIPRYASMWNMVGLVVIRFCRQPPLPADHPRHHHRGPRPSEAGGPGGGAAGQAEEARGGGACAYPPGGAAPPGEHVPPKTVTPASKPRKAARSVGTGGFCLPMIRSLEKKLTFFSSARRVRAGPGRIRGPDLELIVSAGVFNAPAGLGFV